MAFCSKCGNNVPDGTSFCPQCGSQINAAPPQQDPQGQAPQQPQGAPQQNYQAPQGGPQPNYQAPQPGVPYQVPPQGAPIPPNYQPRSKVAAGILGILLGSLGVHNFYLGYTGKAVAQLLITLLTCGIGAAATSIWGLVEGIMILTGSINVDGRGVPLSSN